MRRVASLSLDGNSNVSLIHDSALTFEEAQSQVLEIIRDRVLVGHSIHHDVAVCIDLRTVRSPDLTAATIFCLRTRS